MSGSCSSKSATPSGCSSTRPAARRSVSRQNATARRAAASSLLAVVGLLAGAADDDAVLLDRHLDGPVPGPVLGVDGVVGDGGVEPQPVALLAVVEGAFERGRRRAAPGPAAASAAAPATTRG